MNARWDMDESMQWWTVDYKSFLTILNRPDGFKPAGTPGMSHTSLSPS